jgi:hypothetical protein
MKFKPDARARRKGETMTTRTEFRVRSAVGGLTLALLCGLHFSRVEAAPAEAPSPDHHLQGVWEPLGGAILDPLARGLPGNKGRSMPELSAFPPYNTEYQARYDKTTADLRAGVKLIDGSAKCLPQGMPRMMVVGYPIDIIVQPTRVVMLFEPGAQRRVINTDGRKHTNPEDIDPTYSGESIGHWEGDTLVVDTVGIRDDLLFDYSFAPHSDALHIKERIRRVGDKLEDEMTIEDPKAFTSPWQITRLYQLQPTWELKEYVCDEP